MPLDQVKAKFEHAGNEAATVACVLRDPTNYFEVEARLTDQDFLTSRHRIIWTIIKTLMRGGMEVLDLASMMSQAAVLKVEEDVGGYEYINALFDKSVDPANIGFYLKRVADASTKYKIIQAVEDIADLTEKNKTLTGETLEASALVDYSQDKFLKISVESQRGGEAENISDGLPDLIQEVIDSPTQSWLDII